MTYHHHHDHSWLTGDLTDAKEKDKMGSQQFEEEWKDYYSVIKSTGVEYKTKWLDIRGNHGKDLLNNITYFPRAFSSCKFKNHNTVILPEE